MNSAGKATRQNIVYEEPKVTIAAASVPPPQTSAYTWLVPFRAGLTDMQKKSILHMLDTRVSGGKALNETDARNYAFAVGEVNYQKYVGLSPLEASKIPASQLLHATVEKIVINEEVNMMAQYVSIP